MPIVLAGGVVLALSFGVRAIFGGVVEPLSDELFGGRIEVFSMSIAIQNLVWGLAQPGFGIIADDLGIGVHYGWVSYAMCLVWWFVAQPQRPWLSISAPVCLLAWGSPGRHSVSFWL